MDTSKEYIEMCNKVEPLHEACTFFEDSEKHPDILKFVMGNEVAFKNRTLNKDGKICLTKGSPVYFNKEHFGLYGECVRCFKEDILYDNLDKKLVKNIYSLSNKSNILYLPEEHNLFMMIKGAVLRGKNKTSYANFLKNIGNFALKLKAEMNTMEKIFLSYYMYNVECKTWDSTKKEWVSYKHKKRNDIHHHINIG